MKKGRSQDKVCEGVWEVCEQCDCVPLVLFCRFMVRCDTVGVLYKALHVIWRVICDMWVGPSLL